MGFYDYRDLGFYCFEELCIMINLFELRELLFQDRNSLELVLTDVGKGVGVGVVVGVGVDSYGRGVTGEISGGMVIAAAVEVSGITVTSMLVERYPSLEIKWQSRMRQKNFAVELQSSVCHEQL
ncbi:hypothetical protein Tco_0453127 [Tanacetum coccineum]